MIATSGEELITLAEIVTNVIAGNVTYECNTNSDCNVVPVDALNTNLAKNQVYCVGGTDSSWQGLKSVKIFNTQLETIELVMYSSMDLAYYATYHIGMQLI